MVRVLITYYTRSGNTERMAKEVEAGAKSVAGAETRLKLVSETTDEDLLWADGIIIGSPTYFGSPASEIKALFDRSVGLRGQLENKLGAAFASSWHPAGGRETTILSILQAMLIHGMIVCGDPISSGGHYGAVATGKPDDRAKHECFALGKRVAELASKLR